MFQEDYSVISIEDFLIKKFPNSVKDGDTFASFTSAKEEYNALRNGIGLRIHSDLVLIQMTGKDVLDFLHRVSTNAVKDLKPFEKRNTLFLNEKGRFIDRTTLINFENDFLLIGNADKEKRLFRWINKYIIMEEIQTKDVSEKFALVEFIGSQAESFLTLLLGKEINSFDFTTVRRFDIDGFTFYFFVNQENNGIKIFKALVDKEKCVDFVEYLFSIKSVFDLNVIGNYAFDAFRIENEIPVYPNEINDGTNPHETNLINEVSFKKGCYIGQEVIARLDTYDKVQRKLLKVILGSHVSSDESLMVLDESGNHAGEITSLSNSKLLQEQTGLVLVRRKALENSSRLFIEAGGMKINLTVPEFSDIK